MLSLIRDRFPGRNWGHNCSSGDCITGLASQAGFRWGGAPRTTRDVQGSLPQAFYLHLIKGPCKLRTVMGKAVLMSLLLGCVIGHSRSGHAGSRLAAAALLFAGLCPRGLKPAGPQPWALPGWRPGNAQGRSM